MISIVAVLWHARQLAQSRDKATHVRRLLILLCISFLFIVATLDIWWASEQWNVGEPQHWLIVHVDRLPPNELLGRLGSATNSILFPLLLCAVLTVIELMLGVRPWFNDSSLE
jgi:hypothetical protein